MDKKLPRRADTRGRMTKTEFDRRISSAIADLKSCAARGDLILAVVRRDRAGLRALGTIAPARTRAA
jgi:hypothetical protein